MKFVAKELLAVMKELYAMEFPTQDALDKYLKDHPAADKAKHKVKETKEEKPEKEAPAEKGKGEKEAPAEKDKGKEVPEGEDKVSKPDKISGQEVNDNAWNASVEISKARKDWAKKTIKDKKWMDGASEESKHMAEEYASAPLQAMAEKTYWYNQYRAEIGKKNPSAYSQDIANWKEMSEKGTHPNTKIFKKEEPGKEETKPEPKTEEKEEDFGEQKDYVMTVRKQFEKATGGKKVKDILQKGDEMSSWASGDKGTESSERLTDSVWKGYLKSGTENIAQGARDLVEKGGYSTEDVTHQLELGKARANSVLELAKSGKDMLGKPISGEAQKFLIQKKTEGVKGWDTAIELFKKGGKTR